MKYVLADISLFSPNVEQRGIDTDTGETIEYRACHCGTPGTGPCSHLARVIEKKPEMVSG